MSDAGRIDWLENTFKKQGWECICIALPDATVVGCHGDYPPANQEFIGRTLREVIDTAMAAVS